MKVQTTFPPKEQGMYVCYTEVSEGFNYPQKVLLMWVNDTWGYLSSDQTYKGRVYGYIGPLPAPKISELQQVNKKFVIGPLAEVEFGLFTHGPFDSIKEATAENGEEGQCICVVHKDESKKAKIIRLWDEFTRTWEKIGG